MSWLDGARDTVKRVGTAWSTGGLSELGGSGGIGKVKDSLFGKPGSSSTYEIPGVLSREQGAAYAKQAGNLAGQAVNPELQALLSGNLMNRPRSPYAGTLQDLLTNPAQFGGMSESENNLVNQAYSGRQAQFNALGIGSSPLAQSSIAAAAAPTLAGLRQSRIDNLFKGQDQFTTEQGQFLNNLLNALQQGGAMRGQTLNSYLNLAQLGQPQVGNRSTGNSPGIFGPIDVGGAASGAAAAYTAFCCPPDTLVDTPSGPLRIADLIVGDLVYSEHEGLRIAFPVAEIGSLAVPDDHVMARVVFDDESMIVMSPTHPLTDGRMFGDLVAGDHYGSRVVASATREPYGQPRTYDIRVQSSSGGYFVSGVLVGSTMHVTEGAWPR